MGYCGPIIGGHFDGMGVIEDDRPRIQLGEISQDESTATKAIYAFSDNAWRLEFEESYPVKLQA